MMANSTSQSTLSAPLGIMSKSLGPTRAVVDLKKITGSTGILAPVSAAWSRKFNPMQTILLGRQMGGPRRVSELTRGAEAAFLVAQSRRRLRPSLAKKLSL